MSQGLGRISVGLQEVLGGRTGLGLVGCVLRQFGVNVLGSTNRRDSGGVGYLWILDELILDLKVW